MQNQYGKIQLCFRCEKALEKARTVRVGFGICSECQKKKAREYHSRLQLKNKIV